MIFKFKFLRYLTNSQILIVSLDKYKFRFKKLINNIHQTYGKWLWKQRRLQATLDT